MSNPLVTIRDGIADRQIQVGQHSTAEIPIEITDAVDAAANTFRAKIVTLDDDTLLTNPSILLTNVSGNRFTLPMDELETNRIGHHKCFIEETDGGELVRQHPHNSQWIPFEIQPSANPSSVADILEARNELQTLLQPERTFVVDAQYATATSGEHFGSLGDALSMARTVIAANGGRVTIMVHYDGNGEPIVPALSNISGYAATAYDESIDVVSAVQVLGNREAYCQINVLLEGAYDSGGTMNADLESGSYLPELQPYGSSHFQGSPKFYDGAERVIWDAKNGTDLDGVDIVDWIVVEIRGSIYGNHTLCKKACLLDSNGAVREIGGSDTMTFPVLPGSYYVVVRHRNHLSIMSADVWELVAVSGDAGDEPIDLHRGANVAYGSNAQADLGGGYYGMYAGDAYANEEVSSYLIGNHGSTGYLREDLDLSGDVDSGGADSSLITANLGRVSQVPV